MNNLRRFLFSLLAASSLSAAPFTQPRPGPAVPADAALISGDTAIEKGVLTISIRSTGPEITDWIHIFLDVGDSRQSYNHNSDRPCGFGLEIMLEGALAYRFNGDDPSVWTWSLIEGVAVERRIDGDVLTLRVPVAPLGLPAGRPVHVFAVAYTGDYAETLDTLPRGGTPWRMVVSDHAAQGFAR
mgnify:CR=1 FL=1|jgi:hypothetical protein